MPTLPHKLVITSSVMLKFGCNIRWVPIINMEQVLALHLVAKARLPLNETPEVKYLCALSLPHKLVECSSVMLIFGQHIRWATLITME